jgi:hypothetical protein
VTDSPGGRSVRAAGEPLLRQDDLSRALVELNFGRRPPRVLAGRVIDAGRRSAVARSPKALTTAWSQPDQVS